MSVAELLQTFEAALQNAGLTHMVVGSFASSVHGVPRTTQDLDIVIDPDPSKLDAFVQALDPDSYYVDIDVARQALRRRSMFNVIEMRTAWKVDLIIRKDRAFSIEELDRRIELPIFGILAPVATAEDTIISKLEWARAGESERQLVDVAGILRVRDATLDHHYIERWISAFELAEFWQRAKELAGD
ncbi:MAG: hypothetical protein M4D80_08460 [Myxococcota bacterium]|nr:hypothetical protein [Myxococcota bacterium]